MPRQRKSAADTEQVPSSAPVTKSRRHDWEAVERDYRTGNFTLRELEEKHGPNNGTIFRRARKEGWTQDLSHAVRAATNAALIQEIAAEKCSAAQQDTAHAVLAIAEVNKQVILSHRKRLQTLNADADAARATLIGMAAAIADVREAATYVSALESSARTLKLVIEAERKAYGLDEKEKDGPPDPTEAIAGLIEELRDGAAKLPIFKKARE